MISYQYQVLERVFEQRSAVDRAATPKRQTKGLRKCSRGLLSRHRWPRLRPWGRVIAAMSNQFGAVDLERRGIILLARTDGRERETLPVAESERERDTTQKNAHLNNLNPHVIKMGTLMVFAPFGCEHNGDGGARGARQESAPSY